jgi:hypothetical protein
LLLKLLNRSVLRATNTASYPPNLFFCPITEAMVFVAPLSTPRELGTMMGNWTVALLRTMAFTYEGVVPLVFLMIDVTRLYFSWSAKFYSGQKSNQ